MITVVVAVFFSGGVPATAAPNRPPRAPLSEWAAARPTNPAEFQQDIRTAVTTVDAYWRRVFAAHRVPYRPVTSVIAYRRAGEVTCGGQSIPTDNAVYCPVGHFIAYDINFLHQLFAGIGDSVVYFLFGHEYGHAIQAQLSLRHRYTIQSELQADCLAGAYLGDSIRSNVLRLEPGDVNELL